jgi:hypothetical protein
MAEMRLWHELAAGALLLGVTGIGIVRIAEARNETLVGGHVYALDGGHPVEEKAWAELQAFLGRLGEDALAARLEQLRRDEKLWVAPQLGSDRWAVYVETLRLVRRIYLRRAALLDPRTHLYATPRPDLSYAHRTLHARLTLAGALRHELSHYEGILVEDAAYDEEIAWYEGLRQSAFVTGLDEAERRAWEWALEAAMLSARKARQDAGGRSGPAS